MSAKIYITFTVIFFWMRSCLQPTFHPFSPPEFSVVFLNINSCFSVFSFSSESSLLRPLFHAPVMHPGLLLLAYSVPAHLDVTERPGISAFWQGPTSPSPSRVRSREASLLTQVQYMPPSSAELYHGPCLSGSCVLSPLLNIHMIIIGCSCIN